MTKIKIREPKSEPPDHLELLPVAEQWRLAASGAVKWQQLPVNNPFTRPSRKSVQREQRRSGLKPRI